MSATLTRFCIEGLHNRYTIDIPIRDNKLVLVGENGTNKSIVAKFMYSLMAQEWYRLRTYDFQSITAVINGEEVSLTQEDIEVLSASVAWDVEPFVRLPEVVTNQVDMWLSKQQMSVQELLRDRKGIESLSRSTGIPSRIISDYLSRLHYKSVDTSNEYSLSSKRVIETIDNARFNVLYLPTYRRIEQDIEEVLPYIGESMREKVHSSWRKHLNRVELIEFGMDDVKADFSRKMKHIHNQVNEVFSTGMNLLIGEYLRDVIRGAYEEIDTAHFTRLDATTVNVILNRIDETVLPRQEQEKLRNVITRIHNGEPIQDGDRIIAQFWSRLIIFYQAQQEIEKDVRAFVTVCNTYLSGKKMIYDDVNFTIKIHQTDTGYVQYTNGSEEPDTSGCINLSMLSSGEKQIVSLFSRLYFSEESPYFIIIDEPELSLSVPWQKEFLPHILNSEKCNGLVAVTHSPFIFDNELDMYADDIKRWTRPVGSLSSVSVAS